ncbi:MAG: ABC transporter ATP-binding protein [Opitutales bacterium]|nr:ABC transporter ATP-binding protein [Opitutales bacterium]
MESVIEISRLTKYFRSGIRGILVRALNEVSFAVRRGEIFGLLGPNGAGKSTAIKIMLGLLKQNSGECRIFGEKIGEKTKSKIGYLPEAPNFYGFLTAKELVKFYAQMSGMRSADAEISAENALSLAGLSDCQDRPLSTFSKGMLQRAGLAAAVAHDPELVILDEPNSGLDPIGMSDMKDLILRLKASGKTVLICSHMLREVEQICDSVAILYKGEVAAFGALDEILGRNSEALIRVKNPTEKFFGAVEKSAAEFGADLKVEKGGGSLADFFNKIVFERRGK